MERIGRCSIPPILPNGLPIPTNLAPWLFCRSGTIKSPTKPLKLMLQMKQQHRSPKFQLLMVLANLIEKGVSITQFYSYADRCSVLAMPWRSQVTSQPGGLPIDRSHVDTPIIIISACSRNFFFFALARAAPNENPFFDFYISITTRDLDLG